MDLCERAKHLAVSSLGIVLVDVKCVPCVRVCVCVCQQGPRLFSTVDLPNALYRQ